MNGSGALPFPRPAGNSSSGRWGRGFAAEDRGVEKEEMLFRFLPAFGTAAFMVWSERGVQLHDCPPSGSVYVRS